MSTFFKPIETANIVWRDGLPYTGNLEAIYGSKESGLAEAQHVFIAGNQLIKRWQALPTETASCFVIAETGFGGGINFLLAWSLWQQYAPPSATLHYISSEKHPFTSEDLTRFLALWPQLQRQATGLIANYPVLTPGFHRLQFEEGRISLTLMLGDALSCYQELLLCGDAAMEKNLREYHVDAWFLDGFSSAKESPVWDEQLFTTIGMLSTNNTTIASFLAAAVLKPGLGAAGFKVSIRPVFGCKQDMVVAEFECSSRGRTIRHTPWHVPSPNIVKAKKALVLGAGLAGCYTANALARRGWLVTLVDAEMCVGGGASGNQQAILFPKLSASCSPLNNFMLNAYIFAVRTYQAILKKWPIGELCGMLQLAYNVKEQASQAKLQTWLANYPELGALVSAEEASSLAGILLQSGGMFVRRSGWLDSPALCKHLIQVPGINWVADTNVTSLAYGGGEWSINEQHADVLVIASGYRAATFAQTAHLPITPVHGQMTAMQSNLSSAGLKVPLCADGHILPARQGSHGLGATYHPDLTEDVGSVADDRENLAKLDGFSVAIDWTGIVTGHWAGVRAATPDYLPLVGPVANPALFREQFAGFASDAKRWIPLSLNAYHGLYVCAGFGSRGLTSIPLSAEWLAATINREPSSLPRTMIQSLSPSRFLRREIIRKGN